jgi:hypothetical protein
MFDFLTQGLSSLWDSGSRAFKEHAPTSAPAPAPAPVPEAAQPATFFDSLSGGLASLGSALGDGMHQMGEVHAQQLQGLAVSLAANPESADALLAGKCAAEVAQIRSAWEAETGGSWDATYGDDPAQWEVKGPDEAAMMKAVDDIVAAEEVGYVALG